jgi:hypothetical protein
MPKKVRKQTPKRKARIESSRHFVICRKAITTAARGTAAHNAVLTAFQPITDPSFRLVRSIAKRYWRGDCGHATRMT